MPGRNVTFPEDWTLVSRSCWTLFPDRWLLTILEDSLHVEAVGGASFIVGASFEVVGELPGPGIVDHPRVGRADGV